MIKRLYFILTLMSIYSFSFAQQIPRFNPDTVLTVTIDSAITVTSTRLTVESFINEINIPRKWISSFRLHHYGCVLQHFLKVTKISILFS